MEIRTTQRLRRCYNSFCPPFGSHASLYQDVGPSEGIPLSTMVTLGMSTEVGLQNLKESFPCLTLVCSYNLNHLSCLSVSISTSDISSTMGSMEQEPDIPQDAGIPEVDCLLVGAGFGSYTMINRLRKIGLKCKIYEKGSRSGGIWYWNCYVSLSELSIFFPVLTVIAWRPGRLGYAYLPIIRQRTVRRLHFQRTIPWWKGIAKIF